MARKEMQDEVEVLANPDTIPNHGWRRREKQSLPYLQETAGEVWYVTTRLIDSFSVLLICAASR